jgi:tetratricopeptide (TPR) repeat protein
MTTLKKAIELREKGHGEEAIVVLKKMLETAPSDAQLNYQCAWCHDVLGLEKEAIPYYEKAIACGLPDDDAKEAYLGLGSTYRTVGEYEKSESTLTEGLERYEDNAIRTFLAMAKYNLGKHDQAMEILLSLLANTSDDPSIKSFRKAIAYYSDKLDVKW